MGVGVCVERDVHMCVSEDGETWLYGCREDTVYEERGGVSEWGQSHVSLTPQKTSEAGFQEGEQKLVRPRDLNSQLFHGPPATYC